MAASAILGLAACGSAAMSETATPPTTPPAAALMPSLEPTVAESAQLGPAAIPAALADATTVDGDVFDPAVLAGRPTVAWFWAPWCTVCRAEATDLAAVAAEYSDRVNFVGVAGRGEAPEMREFVADTGVESIIHLDDSAGEIWSAYEIYAQPAFAFITTEGRVETFTGALGADDLSNVVERLIAG